TRAGHRCITVHSASDARACCGSELPRVVVTDLCMPGDDGRSLGLWLKSNYPGMPVVLMTAQSIDGELERSLQHTFDEIFRKPLDPDHLLGWLVGIIADALPVPAAEGNS